MEKETNNKNKKKERKKSWQETAATLFRSCLRRAGLPACQVGWSARLHRRMPYGGWDAPETAVNGCLGRRRPRGQWTVGQYIFRKPMRTCTYVRVITFNNSTVLTVHCPYNKRKQVNLKLKTTYVQNQSP